MPLLGKPYDEVVRRLRLKGSNPPFDLQNGVLPTIILEDFSGALSFEDQQTLAEGWVTQGLQTAAGASTVHANTESLVRGFYEGILWVWGVTATRWNVQLENSDGTLVRETIYAFSQANVMLSLPIHFRIGVENDRVRVLNNTAQGVGNESFAGLLLRRSG